MLDTATTLVMAAVLAGTPLLLGALGEILTERSGNLNLGVEGMMFMGAITGLIGSWGYEQAMAAAGIEAIGAVSALISLLVSFIAGGFGALIYSFLTITLRANQNVTGLVLTIFGTGFANFFGEYVGLAAGGYVAVSSVTKEAFLPLHIPVLSDIPVLGQLLFQYNWIVYFAIGVAVVMSLFLFKTRFGLNLRSVGEDPAAADAAGINVSRYRYMATVIGGGICGIGGMYMSMVTTSGVWVHGCVTGYGWLAVALVIFATWSPLRGILVAGIFGGLMIVRMYISIPGLPVQIYEMLPYMATILVLISTSVRQSKEHAMPASTGLNYFREDRE
ncbi:MAG: ABC transporter permease [Coriobacteriales bacterium]|jgi:simple sugar transport system permease protein|nr:ABC transporter permease [Coriobacteriales bacterium]